MKHTALVPLLGLLALPLAAVAQNADPGQQAPLVASAATVREEPWMAKTIDLDLKDVTPIEAIKKVLEAAGITDYKIADGIEKAAVDIKLGLSFKQVKVGEALRTVCRIAGAAYLPSTKDGKPSVNIVRRSDPANLFTTLAPTGRLTTIAPSPFGSASIALSPSRVRTVTSRGIALPEKRVSIDVRRKSVRDTLKAVLKQADLDFVIEDGIADDLKRSFTFENVPIGTALDAICRSAEVGWTVERKGDKPLIRIGKDIRNGRFTSTTSGQSFLPGEVFNGFDAFSEMPAVFESLPLVLESLQDMKGLDGIEMPKEARLELERALQESRREIERAMKEQRVILERAGKNGRAAAPKRSTKPTKSDKSERPPFEP